MRYFFIGLIIVGLIVGIYFIAQANLVKSASPSPTNTPNIEPIATPETEKSVTDKNFADEEPPAFAKAQFKTDFSIHSVSYTEILSGGPPKDGIPPLIGRFLLRYQKPKIGYIQKNLLSCWKSRVWHVPTQSRSWFTMKLSTMN